MAHNKNELHVDVHVWDEFGIRQCLVGPGGYCMHEFCMNNDTLDSSILGGIVELLKYIDSAPG